MRYSIAPLALAALVAASPAPQVTAAISPSGSAPAGCSMNHSGNFAIQVVNVTSHAKREVQKRDDDTTLVMTLNNGVLKDAKGRTGYIAANRQFQFDGPPQTGAIYTAGWSVCANSSLAIGPKAVFYQCLSGTFYNLYDQSTGAQCNPVYIDVIAAPGSSATSGAVTVLTDGQPQATTGTVKPVTQITDGQIQATTATGAKVTQISDGQIQATTKPTGAVVTQISDGQIQATTKATGAIVSQISDGQIQATTKAASSSAKASGAVVTQITDGQIQASAGVTSARNGTATATRSATPVAYTGAAAPTAIRGEFFGIAAGVLAVALL